MKTTFHFSLFHQFGMPEMLLKVPSMFDVVHQFFIFFLMKGSVNNILILCITFFGKQTTMATRYNKNMTGVILLSSGICRRTYLETSPSKIMGLSANSSSL